MSQRTERVQRLARVVLGEEIQNLKDPRLGFATVTAVRITPDLRHARVFVSVLGSDDEKASTMAALKSATPVLLFHDTGMSIHRIEHEPQSSSGENTEPSGEEQ